MSPPLIGHAGSYEVAKGRKETGSSASGCFDKQSSTACLFSSASAQRCAHVLIADLLPGDRVLGRDGAATTVVSVQHEAVNTFAEMLTFHTADGAAVTMTPDHALFVDGALVAAPDAKVRSFLPPELT